MTVSPTCFNGPFSRELDLAVSGNRVGMAWVEWECGRPERLVCRVLDGLTLVQERVFPVPEGRSVECVTCGFRPEDGRLEVFWALTGDGPGQLVQATVDGTASGVPEFAGRHCADVTTAFSAKDSSLWLAVQAWTDTGPGLELWQRTCDGWRGPVWRELRGELPRDPALAVLEDGTAVLAWTALAARHGELRVVVVGSDRTTTAIDPLPLDGHWVTHPALAVDAGGTVHLACCVERLAEGEAGETVWHSRIVTAALNVDHRGWTVDGQSCIDHAMNPWMAGYAGRRRRPTLVSAPDGTTWILFEEKVDPESMSPGPGRLVLREVGRPIERVLLAGHSVFHVAPQALADGRLVIAELTQTMRYEQTPPPYRLHMTMPGNADDARPAELASNAALPAFRVRQRRPTLRPADGDLRLFFGDPHLHSSLSGDLEGGQEELYLFARDAAGLDFVAFTENDYVGFTHPLTPVAWERSKRNAAFFNAPEVFTTFLAWEYTLHQTPWFRDTLNSHRSVLFPGEDESPCSWLNPDTRSVPDLASFYRGRRVLLHHHHPSGYDITNDSLERNIEVCSGWHNCMRMPTFVDALHGLLNRGVQLGFIGASDNHERNPGLGGALTGVWAEANTREAIFTAFEARRVFATTGLRPDLRFSVSGIPMGSHGQVEGPPVVRVHAACDVPIRTIYMVRDGQTVRETDVNDRTACFEWTDDSAGTEPHWYYAHVRFAGEAPDLSWNRAPAYGVDAWTSPVWITAM